MRRIASCLITLAIFFLAACGSDTTEFGAGLRDGEGRAGGSGRSIFDPFGRGGDSRDATISPGDDTFLNDGARSRPLISQNGDRTNLNLVNVPIADAARAVLDQALNLNYVIDPNVSGTVTIQTSMPVRPEELLDIFQGALEFNGATLSRTSSGVSIVPLGTATPKVAVLGDSGVLGPRVVAVPLNHIGAAEMTRILTPIVGNSVSIQAVPRRSVLLLSGTRDEVNAALEAINLFDVNVLKGKSVAIFRLRSADPEAIVAELDQIFESFPGGALEDALSFVPNRRLGAVLAISSRRQYVEDAREWVAKLDETANRNRRRPVVYSVENRSAADLAPIMANLAGAATDGGSTDGETVRIIADDAKNAVVVWGNDQEQRDMARLLASLDTTPVQVMLEATIAEVTLQDQLDFGVQWFFENSRLGARLASGAGGTINRSGSGLSLIFESGSDVAVLNALNSVTDVDIVSSPSLMVLDNETASLQIGDEVPIATQTVTDPTNAVETTVVSTISFRETGIILNVRPRVSDSGLVILDIEQEVSNVAQTTSSGIDSPTISQRKIKTRVQVTNGSTIALGGLIQDRSNVTRSGVPVLKDVPILGNAFRSKSDSRNKTELLVLITPRVVRNGHEARRISQEFRNRLAEPDALVRGKRVPTGAHRLID